MGALVGEPLPQLDYADRLETLLRHRIGLWDIIASCHRPGSLDSNIRSEERNDFTFLRERCPLLDRVGFNGLKAARLAPAFEAEGYQTLILPSSSPAYTVPFTEKLARWQRLTAPQIERGKAP